MSSVFSNLGTTQNRPSLFTSQPTASQSGTSNFNSLSTSKPAATSSIFASSAPAPQQQQQQQTSGGILGSFSSASQPPQPQSQTTSVLGSVATQNQPPNQTELGQAFLQQQAQPSGAYFDSLLEKSRKRAHGETALDELPSLQLGLGDLRQRIKRLGPSVQDRETDGRGHYLLAASGVDPASAVRDLSYFDGQPVRVEWVPPHAQAPTETDVEGYLASLQTQTTLSMIADGLARSVRDFDAFLDDNVTMEWDAQRKRIYHHFGIRPKEVQGTKDGVSSATLSTLEKGGFGRSRRDKGQTLKGSRGVSTPNGSAFGRPSLSRSVIGNPGPIGSQQTLFADVERKAEESGANLGSDSGERYQREKQGRFADKVQSLNAARLERRGFAVLREFATVEAQSGDQHAEHVVNAYNAAIILTGEIQDNIDQLDLDTVKERQFAKAYLDEAQESQNGLQIRKMILAAANQHLERRFFVEVEALIAKNPREANLGGLPNVTSKMRAYIRLRAANKDLVPENTDLQMLGDDYVWALVFFLLRSGHVKEAVDYVGSNAVAFRAIDRNFITYITSYNKAKEKRLPRELQDRINNEYNQRVRIAPEHSIDPFRMACYKIIGRCEIDKRDFVGLYNSMEDWVWLQFNLAREVHRMGEIATEVYGLAEVQQTITGIGARHFSKGGTDQFGGFGVYFYLQVLAGLYEEAVKYLYTFQYIEGVHFAIALDYYGLLRVADLSAPAGELLTHSTKGASQINFAQMIGHYTRDFRAANVVAAVDYLTLICLNNDLPGDAGAQQTSQCHEALRELILESREFAQLLGDVRSDGQRIPGAIEVRMQLIGLDNTDDFMRTVTIQAASIADNNGRTTDSVLLYHLAGEHDNVITIVNKALSDAVAVEIGQDPLLLLALRPRTGTTPEQHPESSLSLTTVDDPVILAQNMTDLYKRNNIYLNISKGNRDACELLLAMQAAKVRVRDGKWTEALDILEAIKILPMHPGSDSGMVRQCAARYSSLPQTVTRNIPNLIIWAIQSCSEQRAFLATANYGTNDGVRKEMIHNLKLTAKNIMMYSGFLKYRLPVSVNETLARIAAE